MQTINEYACSRSEAVFAPGGHYRFWLSRKWGTAMPFGVFLLHNPSAAGALWLDPTAMKCNNLAVQWGWSGFGIVNLFPNVNAKMSSTKIPNATVAENGVWITRARELADVFVIATGGNVANPTLTTVISRLSLGSLFHAIDENEDGTFRHPRGVSEAAFPRPISISVQAGPNGRDLLRTVPQIAQV